MFSTSNMIEDLWIQLCLVVNFLKALGLQFLAQSITVDMVAGFHPAETMPQAPTVCEEHEALLSKIAELEHHAAENSRLTRMLRESKNAQASGVSELKWTQEQLSLHDHLLAASTVNSKSAQHDSAEHSWDQHAHAARLQVEHSTVLKKFKGVEKAHQALATDHKAVCGKLESANEQRLADDVSSSVAADNLRYEIDVCTMKLKTTGQELEQTKHELQSVEYARDTAQQSLAWAENATANAISQLEELHTIINGNKMRLRVHENRTTTLQKDLEGKQKTIDGISAEAHETQNELIKARVANTVVKQDLEQEQKSTSKLTAELEDANTNLDRVTRENAKLVAATPRCDGSSDCTSCVHHMTRALRIARAGETEAMKRLDAIWVEKMTALETLNGCACTREAASRSSSETLVSPPVSDEEKDGESDDSDDSSVDIILETRTDRMVRLQAVQEPAPEVLGLQHDVSEVGAAEAVKTQTDVSEDDVLDEDETQADVPEQDDSEASASAQKSGRHAAARGGFAARSLGAMGMLRKSTR